MFGAIVDWNCIYINETWFYVYRLKHVIIYSYILNVFDIIYYIFVAFSWDVNMIKYTKRLQINGTKIQKLEHIFTIDFISRIKSYIYV